MPFLKSAVASKRACEHSVLGDSLTTSVEMES